MCTVQIVRPLPALISWENLNNTTGEFSSSSTCWTHKSTLQALKMFVTILNLLNNMQNVISWKGAMLKCMQEFLSMTRSHVHGNYLSHTAFVWVKLLCMVVGPWLVASQWYGATQTKAIALPLKTCVGRWSGCHTVSGLTLIIINIKFKHIFRWYWTFHLLHYRYKIVESKSMNLAAKLLMNRL